MGDEEQQQSETISERRVRLYHSRESAARSISSILTTTGAVEALSEQTSLQGVASVVVGLYLERNAKDPSNLSALAVLPVVLPAVYRAFNVPKEHLVSAAQAFIIALKGFCLFLAVRLLFMNRRLRQLGELQAPKDID